MVLLTTKRSHPRIPAVLVARERLLRQLDAALEQRLTLLSASAGWGKTTLLVDWLRRAEVSIEHADLTTHFRYAWLSLDELDNEPTQFWSAVIASIRRCVPAVGADALALLQVSERAPFSAVLTLLLNDLAAVAEGPTALPGRPEPAPIVLLLDDYRVIDDLAIHESMAFLLEHLPANVHLVLSTRIDPELQLARWQIIGERWRFDGRFGEDGSKRCRLWERKDASSGW